MKLEIIKTDLEVDNDQRLEEFKGRGFKRHLLLYMGNYNNYDENSENEYLEFLRDWLSHCYQSDERNSDSKRHADKVSSENEDYLVRNWR